MNTAYGFGDAEYESITSEWANTKRTEYVTEVLNAYGHSKSTV